MYNSPNAGQSGIGMWCNDAGMIAYRHKFELDKLKKFLLKN